MDRLTKKIENLESYKVSSAFISEIPNKFLDKDYVGKAINKLGKLEDLEEQLGCPLDILAKLMLNGFYYEYPEYDDNDEPTGKMELVYDSCTGVTYLVIGYDKNIYIDVRNLEEPLKLSDYKKTWWLREDRSE